MASFTLTRTQRRRTSLGIQYAIFVVIVLALLFSANWKQLADSFFRLDIAARLFPQIITVALVNTALFTVLAFVFGLTLGLLIALMRLSPVAPYRWVGTVYVEIFRGLPALLWLFMVAYAIPTAFPGYQIAGGVYGNVAIGLGMPAAAYMSETIRAGIQAVPKGQTEAARSLGMSGPRAMFSIVLPQAFRIVIPPLTNEIILLVKDSSLAYVLGVTASSIELTKFGSDQTNANVNPTPLVIAGLCYLIICLPLSQLVQRLERRYQKAR
ncbi:amino acid ABC transporter permease [Fodinicola acaciae]|uniref:amino acid ABC transporter permease n=1 Tax=Fodinicola acaciae TaxID=2681555 RepID=UPI0013D3133D|nr:amino acid ABC transporter permease [Fodinicola acaciae]